MALGKINHFHFYVEDLEETLKFFTEKLGFEFIRRGHGGKSVDLVSSEGGPTFEFNQITEEYKTAKPTGKPGGSHLASIRRPYLDHIAFEVDDINKKFEDMKSKGVKFIVDEPDFNPTTGRKLADAFDNEGHAWIQLQEQKVKTQNKNLCTLLIQKRAMALGKINHFHFYVEDLEETLKFFTEKLGFEFIRRGHGGKSVDLVSSEGGPTFEFNQITEEYKTAKPTGKPGEFHLASIRRPYLDHIAFEVDDMDKTSKEMKSKGVKFLVEPTYNKVTKRKLADVYDNDGHAWLQLQEVKPK